MSLEDGDEVEKPWEERVYNDDYENVDRSPSQPGPPPQPVCTAHKDCFCQRLTQHGFIRKLERSALVHFEW